MASSGADGSQNKDVDNAMRQYCLVSQNEAVLSAHQPVTNEKVLDTISRGVLPGAPVAEQVSSTTINSEASASELKVVLDTSQLAPSLVRIPEHETGTAVSNDGTQNSPPSQPVAELVMETPTDKVPDDSGDQNKHSIGNMSPSHGYVSPSGQDVETANAVGKRDVTSDVLQQTGPDVHGNDSLKSVSNPYPSAFVPVKATSPRHFDERPHLESPLRSPVEREKKDALLRGAAMQTSSLWDSEPQLPITGLIIPTSPVMEGRGNLLVDTKEHAPLNAQMLPNHHLSIQHQQTFEHSAQKSVGAAPIAGIPGFTQTNYPFSGTKSSSHPDNSVPSGVVSKIQSSVPANEQSNQEHPFCDSTSNLSRQSSLGVSSQDPTTTGQSVRDVADHLTEVNRDINQG